jgi:hypothetical protein
MQLIATIDHLNLDLEVLLQVLQPLFDELIVDVAELHLNPVQGMEAKLQRVTGLLAGAPDRKVPVVRHLVPVVEFCIVVLLHEASRHDVLEPEVSSFDNAHVGQVVEPR